MSGVGDRGWEMSCVPCPMSHVPHPMSLVLYPPSHVPCPTSPIPPLTGEQAEGRDAAALHGGQFGDVGDPLEICIKRARPPPWFQRLLRFWGNCTKLQLVKPQDPAWSVVPHPPLCGGACLKATFFFPFPEETGIFLNSTKSPSVP